MYRLLVLLITMLATSTVSAQNAKLGKPTQEEWDMKDLTFAPGANAVVLYKSVEVTYSLNGAFTALGSGGEGSLDDNHYAASGKNKYIDPEGSSMLYDVKLRIKVLKDEGADYTALDIVSHNDEKDMNLRDEFYEMSVTVLSNVNGKVKKRRVAGSHIWDERLDKNYSIRRIRVPDVKAGDIVEYHYQLFSSRITYIFDTQLQESIPVLYSKCVMDIPYFLQFTVNKPEIPNVKATATLGTLLIPSPSNDKQIPRKVNTNHFVIEATALPAYDGEITLENLSSGKVYCVRTALNDKRYDVKQDLTGPVRHLIIGK